MFTNLSRHLKCFFFILVLFCLTACGRTVEIQTNVPENDANEMVGVLLKSGVFAEKKTSKEGATILVPESDIGKAMSILAANGLPRKQISGLGEIFKKEGMISTPLEERARYIFGLSQELEKTLSQIDMVVSSRVHVVLPERIAPGEPITPSSAAIFIKHRKGLDVDLLTPRIRNMVSNSIPGLSDLPKDKISIVFVETPDIKIGLEWTMVGPVRVDATSASALQAILMSLFVFSIVMTIFAIFAVLQPHKVRKILRIDK
ncbi:MAG: type III secretion system inner membrane ring lipoprotein SctJ [Chitinophagaceae bacterium]